MSSRHRRRVLLDTIGYAALYSAVGGVSRFARSLLTALPELDKSHEYAYYCYPSRLRRWRPIQSVRVAGVREAKYVCSPIPERFRNIIKPAGNIELPGSFVRSASIMHSLNWIPAHLGLHCAAIATVYDTAVARFADMYTAYGGVGDYGQSLDASLRGSLGRCAAVITISHDAAADIADVYDYPYERIYVAYPWVSEELIRSACGDRATRDDCYAQYVLTVGDVWERKNQAGALEAFARVASKVSHSYVIAGRSDIQPEYTRRLLQRAAELGLSDRLVVTDRVSDSTLAALYSGASALLFPSIHEGFGYPLIEAMHFGVPIITSDAGSLPEVVGKAGLVAPANDVNMIAEALEAVLFNNQLRAKLIASGRARSTEFTQERAVASIVAAYRAVE